ncbi:M1 family metallopeptidase [Acanthopleuribacter pedis]|uniref:Aminopeptidase N n=1 Tax=Acanthopleuribacter pedis TaxID=442870 RepID=A0A8J7QE06_9BACT|nr:M1 family metallopeptidase [Acanthopleuribacter pedis]MBO1322842.1 M1 family metallopeptidase [Acanthopleuribacter pedis]
MLIIGCLTMFAFSFSDVHTFGNVDQVRTSHLSLDLTLDFERKIMKGSCVVKLAYQSKQGAPHVDLDTRLLTIESVTDPADGSALKYELHKDARDYMGAKLRIFLKNPKTPAVKVTYVTDPSAGALQWLDPAQTTSKKKPFLLTQSQAILARTWIPCMDSPGIRVTYDAVVRVPKGITAVMSAAHGKHEPENGVYRFDMKHPIPPYLIALAAGEIAFKAISDRCGVYAEPAVVEKAAWEFADMEKMVVAAEKLYGKYRWDRWDAIVLPPSFPFGGMENPMLTFATPTLLAGDRSLVNVMAHELAHSWSGNLVTNATWSDFWLNEGFTTYFERRIVEALYGKDTAEMQWLLGQRDLQHEIVEMAGIDQEFAKLYQDLSKHDPDAAFSSVPYDKGANFLLVLEQHFGRAKFDTFLKTYFDQHAFQTMTTDKFLDFMRKNLFGDDQAAWEKLQIDAWINDPGIPKNIVIPKSQNFEKTRAAAKAFAAKGDTGVVKKDSWNTEEWLDFLNSLPEKVDHDRLKTLDAFAGLTNAGNAEILFAWQMVCIRNTYEPAFASLQDFLLRQGRRKFLKPLYQAMMANPKTEAMAKEVYKKARAGYHPISTATIDAIVK